MADWAQGIGQAAARTRGCMTRNAQPVTSVVHGLHHAAGRTTCPSFQAQPHHDAVPGQPARASRAAARPARSALSAAVINAITDAIGNNRLEMPATPDRVWHADPRLI